MIIIILYSVLRMPSQTASSLETRYADASYLETAFSTEHYMRRVQTNGASFEYR